MLQLHYLCAGSGNKAEFQFKLKAKTSSITPTHFTYTVNHVTPPPLISLKLDVHVSFYAIASLIPLDNIVSSLALACVLGGAFGGPPGAAWGPLGGLLGAS